MPFYEDVQFAKSEFEVLWEEAKNCEINASDVTSSINQTYLKGDLAPYDLYIKMLMEYFSDRILESDHYNVFDMPKGYTSYDYQTDAVIEGYQKLIRYDGFFLADVVGLGKTRPRDGRKQPQNSLHRPHKVKPSSERVYL